VLQLQGMGTSIQVPIGNHLTPPPPRHSKQHTIAYRLFILYLAFALTGSQIPTLKFKQQNFSFTHMVRQETVIQTLILVTTCGAEGLKIIHYL
jgi:hypothetical protein